MAHCRPCVFLAALTAVAGCAGAIAPAPPASAPALSGNVVVLGAPIAIAARAARNLQIFAYSTKRFGPDSTWGHRGADKMSVRLRYTKASRDSTRALIDVWGRCERGNECLRDELSIITAAISTEEPPPP
jgi:hypothetical protein